MALDTCNDGMALRGAGRTDTIAACTECEYAANVERAAVLWGGRACTSA